MPRSKIVRRLLEPTLEARREDQPTRDPDGQAIRIAIPVANGALCAHFGHCDRFALFDVAADGKTIANRELLEPPPHEPGVLPKWLEEKHATVIIAGGMGTRAQSLFDQHGIDVVIGAAAADPEQLVGAYLDGTLQTGDNICDH